MEITINESNRKAENLSHQKRRHWDMREFDEYIIATECSHIHIPTPEEILCHSANSNRDKEPRVYQELKEYNFWRNLYGAKKMALAVYFVIAIREMVIIEMFNLKQSFLQPYPEYIALIIMIICILFMLLLVSQKTVNQKGFDYAKALIEVCERIPVNAYEEEKG